MVSRINEFNIRTNHNHPVGPAADAGAEHGRAAGPSEGGLPADHRGQVLRGPGQVPLHPGGRAAPRRGHQAGGARGVGRRDGKKGWEIGKKGST